MTEQPRPAPLFRPRPPQTPAQVSSTHHDPANSTNPIPSSSPAFATPAHPIRPFTTNHAPPTPTILPILIPPATLRPLAFRTFTKKHNLTLSSAALAALATFIGKHCGAGWREEGLAEKVLDEVAKGWKNAGGGVIVEGDGEPLKSILRTLGECMRGGRILDKRGLSRQSSFAIGSGVGNDSSGGDVRPGSFSRADSQSSFGMSALDVDDDDEDQTNDPRRWLKVVGAFHQPRLTYNVGKKHFEKISTPPSLFPPPSHKTHLFRNRYNLIHQRLLRNEKFQTPTVARSAVVPSLQRSTSSLATTQSSYTITPIANLLGRSGSQHLLLGLLTIAPNGTLAIGDLTGSIALDVQHAIPIPQEGSWFAPGMIVLVEGIYEEEYNSNTIGDAGGIGGTISGKFIGLSIGGPPAERREITLGISGSELNGQGDTTAGGGFGWVDFLGVGSERALGSRMRRIEQRMMNHHQHHHTPSSPDDDDISGRARIVILGELNLDQPRTLEALKKVLGLYAAEPASSCPMTFLLLGNFVSTAVMAGTSSSGDSVAYKEYFDALAAVLGEFPTLLASSTFVFVPGDNDPWASSFAAGAATVIPRDGVPELFTSRVKRAFASAIAELDRSSGGLGGDDLSRMKGEAVWTTNPARVSLFGPVEEMVVFRDDMSARLRRNALRFKAPPRETTEERNGETNATAEKESRADERRETEDDILPDAPPPASSPPPPSSPPAPLSSAPPVETTIATRAPSTTAPLTNIPPPSAAAKKLSKTLLDQSHLSPFPLATRPVLWDHADPLSLYPLPTALILCDPGAERFVCGYAGCWVVNVGGLIGGVKGERREAGWVEYFVGTGGDRRRGKSVGKGRERIVERSVGF
ncbi:MAG: DNA-directed DNA polymerase epsilon, subunit B [Caeruleum heppii]|nr:MAG: DNA-directed DNA polymerase epsilon, subunit B [Caeruleum heppii]